MPCLLPIMPMVVVSSTQVSLMLRLGGPPVTPDDHAGAVDAGGTASQRVAAARAALRERVVVLTRAAAAAGPETNEVECGKVGAMPFSVSATHRTVSLLATHLSHHPAPLRSRVLQQHLLCWRSTRAHAPNVTRHATISRCVPVSLLW